MPAFANIFRLCAVFRHRHDLCAVFPAIRTEYAHRIIILPLFFRRILRAVLVQYVKYFLAVLQRKNNMLRISPAAVFLRLEMIFHLDPEILQRVHEFFFKMLGITLAAPERIGNVRIRIPNVFLK